jgi:hypothetical protein
MENEIDLENALKILFFSHSTSNTSSTIKTVQQPTNTNFNFPGTLSLADRISYYFDYLYIVAHSASF